MMQPWGHGERWCKGRVTLMCGCGASSCSLHMNSWINQQLLLQPKPQSSQLPSCNKQLAKFQLLKNKPEFWMSGHFFVTITNVSTHNMIITKSMINNNLYIVLDLLHLLKHAVKALVTLKLDYELNGKYFSGTIQLMWIIHHLPGFAVLFSCNFHAWALY